MSSSKTQSLIDSLGDVFERAENPERIVAALLHELAKELDLATASLLNLEPAGKPGLYRLRPLATYSLRHSYDNPRQGPSEPLLSIPRDSPLSAGDPITGDIPDTLRALGESIDVVIPLSVRETPRALLLLRSRSESTHWDMDTLRALKPLVLSAVTAHRAFSRFRRYEAQLERQLRVSPDFRFDQLADELFVRARKILGGGRMFVFHHETEEKSLRLLAASWDADGTLAGYAVPCQGSALGEVLAAPQPQMVRVRSVNEAEVGGRAITITSHEARLFNDAPFLVVPVRNDETAIGLFGIEWVHAPEAKLKANAEAETFFAALGRILFYSRVHQSLLLDNRRVASVNQAAKQVREGVFHIEPQWLDRASALDQVDDPVKGLAQLAEELKSGIDLLVKSFSQLVGFVDALYQVGSAGLDVGEDVSAYLRKVVRLLRDRMGYERVIALLADAETTTLHSPVVNYEYESPEEAARVQGVRVDWMANRRGVWAWVARNQRELYVADAHADFVEDEHSGERVYISSELVQLFKGNSFLAVPLLSRQQTGGVPKLLGLLSVASLHSDRIRKSDLNVMRAIARQIGLTLENASLHDHLQKQIAEQDRELQKQRQELRESYYRLFRYERNEFHLDLTAGLAHDLKNPLIAGRQYLQVLRMELAGFVKDASAGGEDDQRLIDEFRATAEKYIDKVADVLLKVQERLRDIELRATETEPESNEQLCDVLTALNESLADIPQAMRSGIAFHRSLQEVPPIRSHPDSLRSLFMNLITNAIEAIPKERGGDIWIALRPDGRDIVLTVEDNGRGIPAHDLDKVFQARFTTKPRGTGLGLAWVHRNVTQHLNGRIHAESGNLGDGKRTRFTVRLPTATQGES